jgi:hypothetical protein
MFTLIPKTLPTRVALAVSLTVGLFLALFFLIMGNNIKTKLEQQVTDEALNNAKRFASFTLGYFFYQDNLIHLETQQKTLSQSPNVLYSYIVSAQNKIAMGINGLDSPDIDKSKQPWEPQLSFTDNETKFTADAALADLFPHRVNKNTVIRLVNLPLNCAEQLVNCAYLRVALLPESHLAFLSTLTTSLAIAGILIVLVFGIVVYGILAQMLAPLSIISKELALSAAGKTFDLDAAHQIPANAPVEILNLKKSLVLVSEVFGSRKSDFFHEVRIRIKVTFADKMVLTNSIPCVV